MARRRARQSKRHLRAVGGGPPPRDDVPTTPAGISLATDRGFDEMQQLLVEVRELVNRDTSSVLVGVYNERTGRIEIRAFSTGHSGHLHALVDCTVQGINEAIHAEGETHARLRSMHQSGMTPAQAAEQLAADHDDDDDDDDDTNDDAPAG